MEAELRFGGEVHHCTLTLDEDRCAAHGWVLQRVDPPWNGWTRLCLVRHHLTMPREELDRQLAELPAGYIGVVSSVPVDVRILR